MRNTSTVNCQRRTAKGPGRPGGAPVLRRAHDGRVHHQHPRSGVTYGAPRVTTRASAGTPVTATRSRTSCTMRTRCDVATGAGPPTTRIAAPEATVAPGATSRCCTRPSSGARIVAYSRFTCAACRSASATSSRERKVPVATTGAAIGAVVTGAVATGTGAGVTGGGAFEADSARGISVAGDDLVDGGARERRARGDELDVRGEPFGVAPLDQREGAPRRLEAIIGGRQCRLGGDEGVEGVRHVGAHRLLRGTTLVGRLVAGPAGLLAPKPDLPAVEQVPRQHEAGESDVVAAVEAVAIALHAVARGERQRRQEGARRDPLLAVGDAHQLVGQSQLLAPGQGGCRERGRRAAHTRARWHRASASCCTTSLRSARARCVASGVDWPAATSRSATRRFSSSTGSVASSVSTTRVTAA